MAENNPTAFHGRDLPRTASAQEVMAAERAARFRRAFGNGPARTIEEFLVEFDRAMTEDVDLNLRILRRMCEEAMQSEGGHQQVP